MELLTGLNDEGTTVILITHDPEVAENARRQIALKDGHVESDSSVITRACYG